MTSADASTRVTAAFLEEGVDLLRDIERCFCELAEAGEPEREHLIRQGLRSLHTLKGAAAAAGFASVQKTAHELEERIRAHEAGGEPWRPERIDAVLAEVQAMLQELLHTSLGAAMRSGRDDAQGSFADVLRIAPERVDQLHNLVAELTLARLRYGDPVRRLRKLAEKA